MRSSSLSDPLSLPLALCLVSLFVHHVFVSATSQPVCYWEYENQEASAANDGPCAAVNGTSGPVSCCSSGDTCMGNNICYGLGGSHPHGSGYYLSGCTDITLSDSSCTSHCVSNGYPDIVYNATADLWACCTVVDFQVNCSLPTKETFSAPAPSVLTGTFVAHSSTAGSTFTTASSSIISRSSSSTSSLTTATSAWAAVVSQTSDSSSTATPLSSDPLSTGAKAGIAVSVGVAFLVIFGLAIAFIHARRKSHMLANGLALQNARSGLNKWGYGYAYGDLSGSGSPSYSQVPLHEAPDAGIHELHLRPAPVELSGTLNPAELGGWDNYYGGNYRIPGPVKKHDTYYHP